MLMPTGNGENPQFYGEWTVWDSQSGLCDKILQTQRILSAWFQVCWPWKYRVPCHLRCSPEYGSNDVIAVKALSSSLGCIYAFIHSRWMQGVREWCNMSLWSSSTPQTSHTSTKNWFLARLTDLLAASPSNCMGSYWAVISLVTFDLGSLWVANS